MNRSTATTTYRPRAASGFTLVELTIVVLMIAILAAMVIPKLSNGTDQSRSGATAAIVKSVQTMIQYAENSPDNFTGTIPATIDPNWFADKKLPINPWDEGYAGARVNNDASATASQTHPTFKTIAANGVFWYNPSNGRFRALIPDQGSDEANIALYNAVNSTNIVGMDQSTGG